MQKTGLFYLFLLFKIFEFETMATNYAPPVNILKDMKLCFDHSYNFFYLTVDDSIIQKSSRKIYIEKIFTKY